MITLVTSAFSHQEHCSRYEVVTQSSSIANSPCKITLSQLIAYQNESIDRFLVRFFITGPNTTEIVFQSGVHQATEIAGCQPLLFQFLDRVNITGQRNVTIDCLNSMFIYFDHVSSFKIQNVHLQNCACHEGYGPGVVFSTIHLSTAIILDSKFTNSRLIVKQLKKFKASIIISNVVFEDCCSSKTDTPIILLYTNHSAGSLSLTMHGLKVQNNISPFLYNIIQGVPKRQLISSIALIGHNFFTGNAHSIIFILCSYTYKDFCTLRFSNTTVYFTNNKVNTESLLNSPITMISGKVQFERSHVIFTNNSGNFNGSFFARYSKIIFCDNVYIKFSNNVGKNGGALFLDSKSTMIFNATRFGVSLHFVNNTAHKGGAIFVEDVIQGGPFSIMDKYDHILKHIPTLRSLKTVHITDSDDSFLYEEHSGVTKILKVKSVFDAQCNTSLVKLIFRDNLALLGGDNIYGGWVDWSVRNGLLTYTFDTMEEILTFDGSSSSVSGIASEPVRICLCESNHPNCNITNHSMEIYGYVAHLDLVAVGQRFTPVKAYVDSNYYGFNDDQLISPSVYLLQESCTTVTYKLYSDDKCFIFKPYYEGQSYNILKIEAQNTTNDSATVEALFLFKNLSIKFKANPCPLGFSLHKVDRSCICQERLAALGLTCDLTSTQLRRNIQQWVSTTYIHTNSTHNDTGPEVIIHKYCPFRYCKTDEESLLFRLEDKDELCAFNRHGILCGGCKMNFSRVVGSSGCKVCSSNLLLLAATPVWLLLGILLVTFLMSLNLTISAGTINGIVFYINVIHTQHSTFFTPTTSNSFLSKFISWLNLDQGIELCLYDGLDTYTITWLQFLFPLYIWTITVAMIVLSHYYASISRFIGNNTVPVLATLFLITYTKIFRLIIDVISFTTITYPDGYKSRVWLVDGNLTFLSGKHIPLFLVGLTFLLFLLIYTLMLLLIQLLHKISHYRVMFWVNKVKPLFDAHTRPYKANHQYWTGLLFIVRITLLTIFSLNRMDNPTINLLAITLVSMTLLLLLYFTGWVYNGWLNNCLEVFFLSNLCFTSTAVLYELSNNEHTSAVIYASTGSTLVVFVAIITYHAQQWLHLTRAGSKLGEFLRIGLNNRVLDDENKVTHLEGDVQPSQNVTYTIIKLSELLRDDEKD